jgi:hypothetical protein
VARENGSAEPGLSSTNRLTMRHFVAFGSQLLVPKQPISGSVRCLNATQLSLLSANEAFLLLDTLPLSSFDVVNF